MNNADVRAEFEISYAFEQLAMQSVLSKKKIRLYQKSEQPAIQSVPSKFKIRLHLNNLKCRVYQLNLTIYMHLSNSQCRVYQPKTI